MGAKSVIPVWQGLLFSSNNIKHFHCFVSVPRNTFLIPVLIFSCLPVTSLFSCCPLLCLIFIWFFKASPSESFSLMLFWFYHSHSLCGAQLVQSWWFFALHHNSQPWSSIFSSATSPICSMSNASLDFGTVFYSYHVLVPFSMPTSMFEIWTLHPFFRSILHHWNSSAGLHLFCHLLEMYYSLFILESPLEMKKTLDFIYWWTVLCWGMVLVKRLVPVKSLLHLSSLHS